MNRIEFLKLCKEYLDTHDSMGYLYYFDIDVTEVDDKVAMSQAFAEHFSPLLDKLAIKNHNEFLKDIKIESEFDWDYSEEEEDGEFCRYNCKTNLHRIYDNYVLQADFPLKTVTLYRIETKEGNGLYNSGFAATKNMNDNQPDPCSDPLLKSIFDSKYYPKDSDYQRQWYFAFSNLEDIHKWTGNQLDVSMQQHELQLKKIILPVEFMIEGSGQTVFKKSEVVQEFVISLDSIKPKKLSKLSV